MADVSDWNTGVLIKFFLERKKDEHVRNRLPDLVNPAFAPTPYRRADKVNRWNARFAKLHFQSKVEVGSVDADEYSGARFQNLIAQGIADALNFPVMRQHFKQAAH